MLNTRRSLATIGLMLACCMAHAQMGHSIGTWGTSPVAAPAGDSGRADVTLREVVHVSAPSGQFIYVTLSNEFGTDPLIIGEASVARRTSGGARVGFLGIGSCRLVGPANERATDLIAR